MNYFSGLCVFVTVAGITIPEMGRAQDESANQPGKYVATVLSDDCIVTAGYAPEGANTLDLPLGTLSRTVTTPPENDEEMLVGVGAVASAIGIELARTVIKAGTTALGKSIAEKARDKTYTYSNVVPTYLYRLHQMQKEILKQDQKGVQTAYSREVHLNPDIRCVTILTNVGSSIVTKKTVQKSVNDPPWKDDWLAKGPSKADLDKRLKNAGISSVTDFSTVFEAKMEFSADGSAVYLRPRYLRVLNHYGKKNNTVSRVDGTRSLGFTITLSRPNKPGAEAQVASETFIFEGVTTETGEGTTISSLQSKEGGFGPEQVRMLVSATGWQPFTPGAFTPSDAFKKAVLGADADKSDQIDVGALNVKTSMVANEKGSELFKFLDKFFKQNDVETKLSDALIDGLGLRTEDEEKTALLGTLNAEIARVKAFKTLYETKNGSRKDDEDFKEEYDASIKAFDDAIFQLELAKLEVDYGCDPTGLLGTACP